MKIIKLLSLILAVVLLLSFVACDLSKEEPETSGEQSAENTTGQSSENDATEPEETTEAGNVETTDNVTTPTDTETTVGTETTADIETTVGTETTADTETTETTETTPPTVEYQIISIAEALELCGEPGNVTTERYYIRATIKTVTDSTYGKMILTDGVNEIEVYGTYSADGELRYCDLAEKPYKGDEVLLHCILQNYNGTKEIKNARLIEFKSNQGEFDLADYKSATIAEARAAKEGDKLLVSGTVVRITYSTGMKPNGFILVNGADSIYVFDGDAAGRVSIGNNVQIAATKTYWILDTEQYNAQAHGYKGCNQLAEVTLVSNDEGNNEWVNASIPTATVKELMDTPVTEDITTQIYKTTALIKKAPGNGFTNYYINDLDEKTGSYVYTQCNGSDFSWLDEFDGKICTVYFVVLNAKSSVSGCVYRLLPIKVINENYTFNTDDAAEFSAIYHGATQFDALYTGNPQLELVGSVSSALLGFENATLTYASSNESVIKIDTVDGKAVMNCLATGTATITVTGSYNGKTYSESVEIEVSIVEEVPSIGVGEAISSEVGEIVTVKGIVGPSLVNQTGFYLIDETGVIAVCMTDDELAKVQLGNEIILSGTRAIRLKDGFTVFGQANLDACTIIANNYGSHDYSTASFITDKDLAYVYNLDENEDHGAEVYVLTATIVVEDSQYYSNIYVSDGTNKLRLYCSSASQYNWLKAYAGQTVTVEVAPCNWNAKNYYTGCVLAVVNADGTKTCNELNFSK